jgi:hypothetical protein
MSSYARGGRRASETDTASKQAVKKLVHETEAEMPVKELKEPKKLRQLHIVADEDHVAAQFWKEKGDLQAGTSGQKINTMQAKLICVYEDIVNESGAMSKNPRYALRGKRYFSGVYAGTNENERLWRQVAEYIEATYDTETLEKIYIAGDGASWIKMGCEVLENGYFVLDRFHMKKYVNKSVAHLGDDISEVKTAIWEALDTGNKKEIKRIYRWIIENTDNENKKEEVIGVLKYFTNNWDGIQIQVDDVGARWGCCAEGQVSHLLSDRMSSRPMGWSPLGCDRMAKLRAFKWNGGRVIDLLKHQKEKNAKEERRREQEELLQELSRHHDGWDYAGKLNTSIPGLERPDMKWLRNLINQKIG